MNSTWEEFSLLIICQQAKMGPEPQRGKLGQKSRYSLGALLLYYPDADSR